MRKRTVIAALTVGMAIAGTSSALASDPAFDASPKPYMGWSSWSLQASRYPGLNTLGRYSWLTEDKVVGQVDAMASTLKPYGYEYINIDAGWWMDWAWNMHYDQYGRQKADAVRFPHGMQWIGDYIHSKGLKYGIYMPVGLEKGAYNNGDNPIWNAPGCTTKDVVFADLRETNGWNSAYAMDFSNPCAQKYIDSIVALFDGWGVDFLKLDGVGYGSGRTPAQGTKYDNRADVAAWDKALQATGRHIEFQLSWSLDHDYVADWQTYSDSWRVDFDIECYCNTLVRWSNQPTDVNSFSGGVKSRFAELLPWIDDAGPATGWNNLDSVNVGNGVMDGLTNDERQTYMTLWSIAASPLYLGDDLTKLDAYGLSLLTNREVLAINQAGVPAKPTAASQRALQEVWSAKLPDGKYVVALFNLANSAADVTAKWDDLGLAGAGVVRDLWSHTDLGNVTSAFSATVPAHGSRLLLVTPGVETSGGVGGAVPATLSLAMGAPASFGAFTPGMAKDYTASTTATVISTAGDATLSVSDPSSAATGRLVNGAFSLPQALQAGAGEGPYTAVGAPTPLLTYTAPVSNDVAAIGFKQAIGASDALRTGAYSKALTFTLSTTTP
jgi:hypothetical protein